LRVPLLFIAAKQDAYGFAPTEQLYRAAQTADKQLLVVPGQAHGFFDLDPSGPKVDARILDFIRTHAAAESDEMSRSGDIRERSCPPVSPPGELVVCNSYSGWKSASVFPSGALNQADLAMAGVVAT